jgi:predicted kinase
MLVVFRGLPGTGKSHLVAGLVRERPQFLILSRDSLRAHVLPHPTFQADEKNLVDDLIVSMAEFLLSKNRDVVIDGMALSSASRVDAFAHAAQSCGAQLRVVQCVCSEKTALARIARDGGAHPAGDRGEALYRETRERFQPIAHPFLTVDTDRDPAESLAIVLNFLSAAMI